MELIVITGPQGCGKSRNANALKSHYRADVIVEEYNPSIALPKTGRVLALSNIPASQLRGVKGQVIEYRTAMEALHKGKK